MKITLVFLCLTLTGCAVYNGHEIIRDSISDMVFIPKDATVKADVEAAKRECADRAVPDEVLKKGTSGYSITYFFRPKAEHDYQDCMAEKGFLCDNWPNCAYMASRTEK